MSKFCVNCRHYFNLSGACLLTKKISIDPVTSKINSHYMYAFSERGINGTCGEKGDLYQAENSKIIQFLNKNPYSPVYFGIGCMIGTYIGIINSIYK